MGKKRNGKVKTQTNILRTLGVLRRNNIYSSLLVKKE